MASAPSLPETLNDPLLTAFDQLPDGQHLTPKQVATLLQVSDGWLEARRQTGKPPLWVEMGPRMVRYTVGTLRAWMRSNQEIAPKSSFERTQRERDRIAGLDEEIMRPGRRRQKSSIK